MQHLTSTKFDRKITTPQLRKQIYTWAKQNGIKTITFSPVGKKTIAGTYNAKTNSLYLNTNQTKKHLLEAFFHEMGHFVAVKHQNKWKGYHYCTRPIHVNEAFNIENKIDKIANKLWNAHVDSTVWGKYNFFYPKKMKSKLIKTL